MAKRFDEVHIISKERNISDKEEVAIEDETTSNLMVHKVLDGLVSSNLGILRVATDVGADVLFADGIGHGASSLLCKKKYRIPLITFFHGYEADLKAIGLKLRLRMKPTSGLLSEVFSVYDAIILRASNKVLCLSRGLAEYARRLLPKKDWNKIRIIPQSFEYVNYISEEALIWADDVACSLKASNKRGSFRTMVVGIGPSKGTNIALKAHKYIVEENPNAVMMLVGKTVDPKYVSMAEKLKLKDNILFLQNLPRDHVLALLSYSSILLCPSLSEGFSRVVSEAMSLNVPVISYMNKSLRDAVGKGAVVAVRTTDPKDYARECVSLVNDEKLKEELIQKARDYIQPFVLFPEEKRLELICNSIDQVLSKKH